jgi:hypothetical protein
MLNHLFAFLECAKALPVVSLGDNLEVGPVLPPDLDGFLAHFDHLVKVLHLEMDGGQVAPEGDLGGVQADGRLVVTNGLQRMVSLPLRIEPP